MIFQTDGYLIQRPVPTQAAVSDQCLLTVTAEQEIIEQSLPYQNDSVVLLYIQSP